MAKVIFHTHDPMLDCIYSKEETIEMFGEDFLVDYGIEIPDSLLERYQRNWEELWKIQKEIKEYTKENKNDNEKS